MSAAFKRARIVPFDAAGRTTQDDKAILFDFNPDTLTLKVTASKSKDKQRKGRQQVQHVGTSEATLSFEAIFDSTRPRDGEDGRAPEDEEKLDVRRRTLALAGLIQEAEKAKGGGAGKNQQPAPKRVQFRWGSIIFNGLITSYQEVFDYFSPGGVPLRSKVQVTITEQEFRYEVDSTERSAARAAAPPSPAGLRDAAAAAGAESLFAMGPGALSLGLSAGVSGSFGAAFSAGASLQANLGIQADIGLSAGAGISLSADAAVDVFGGAALGGGGTEGKAGLPTGVSSQSAGAASPWAPDGPAPGTRAAGLAAVINSKRAGGTALSAPNATAARAAAAASGGAAVPLALRGSPPPALPRAPAGSVPAALRSAPREIASLGERRPRWEGLAALANSVRRPPPDHHAAHGCGCLRCRGGH